MVTMRFYLCHAFAPIYHFIALSAASPFHQGVDTSFDYSRLAVISAFLCGTPPWLVTWEEFTEYYEKWPIIIIKNYERFLLGHTS